MPCKRKVLESTSSAKKRFSNLRILVNEDLRGVRVVTDDGCVIEGITKVKWEMSVDDIVPRAEIHLYDVELIGARVPREGLIVYAKQIEETLKESKPVEDESWLKDLP